MNAPLLIFAYGNPARGDDALGPLLAQQAERWIAEQNLGPQVEVLSEYQLSPEHAYDLLERQHVIFIDAAAQQASDCVWQTLTATAPALWTSHASSPAALLWYCQDLLQRPAPRAAMLSLATTDFELGNDLSARGRAALLSGWRELRQRLEAELALATGPK